MWMFWPFIAVVFLDREYLDREWRVASSEQKPIRSPFAITYSLFAIPYSPFPIRLLDDARHHAGADRAAALADGETQLLLPGDRNDQRDLHGHIIARQHPPRGFRQRPHAGPVGGAALE